MLPADETEISRLLQRCVEAPDKETFAQFRDELIQSHASVMVESAVRRQFRMLRRDDALAMKDLFQDTCNESYVDLMQRLERIWKNGGRERIEDFDGYSYVVAVNTFRRVRAGYVSGAGKTQNRIKALIDRSDILERWKDDGISYCALLKHQRRTQPVDINAVMADLSLEIGTITYFRLSKFVGYLLKKLGHGITINQMARLATEILISERRAYQIGMENISDSHGSIAEVDLILEKDQMVERLWNQIMGLSPKQRKALLLYASDGSGNSFVESIFNSGIARLADIAAALEIDKNECAHLMPSLPLSTDEIAGLLGVETGSVYDIRQSAERSLARRFAGVEQRKREAAKL